MLIISLLHNVLCAKHVARIDGPWLTRQHPFAPSLGNLLGRQSTHKQTTTTFVGGTPTH